LGSFGNFVGWPDAAAANLVAIDFNFKLWCGDDRAVMHWVSDVTFVEELRSAVRERGPARTWRMKEAAVGQ
jgi:hypothetical protein